MEHKRDKKEKDTLLEMGSLNPEKETENMVQMKRSPAEANIIADVKSPDDADDNDNTTSLENDIADDDSSSCSSEEDEHSHELDPNSFKGKLAQLMKSNVMQYFVIAMVIVDCLIIVLELLIDMDFIIIPEDEQPHSSPSHDGSHPVASASTNSSMYHHNHHGEDSSHGHILHIHNSTDHNNTSHHEHHHHTNKEKAEHILHALSLTILSLFMIEVSMKIYVEGKHLLKQKAEVFDAVVVIVSFTLDIVFSFVSVESAAKDAAGLMVLLRLWRVTRIINGVILSVKMEAKKKSDALKKVIRQLEHENRKQRSKMERLEKENTMLRQQLAELNGGVAGRPNKVSDGHHHHHHSHHHDSNRESSKQKVKAVKFLMGFKK